MTVAILLFGLVVAVLEAVALATMWGWFVVPLGAPAIGVAHAYGLFLLVYLVTARPPDEDAGSEYALRASIFGAFVALWVLAFGWIALQIGAPL